MTIEAGIGRNVWSKISDSGALRDQYGSPKLIRVDGSPRISGTVFGAGADDLGPYVSCVVDLPLH